MYKSKVEPGWRGASSQGVSYSRHCDSYTESPEQSKEVNSYLINHIVRIFTLRIPMPWP